MKERIRDLEKQSGIDVYSLGLDRAKWESKLEKFAQLMVKECANKIEHDYKYVKGNDTKWNTAFTIACDLKEHFGVEE